MNGPTFSKILATQEKVITAADYLEGLTQCCCNYLFCAQIYETSIDEFVKNQLEFSPLTN